MTPPELPPRPPEDDLEAWDALEAALREQSLLPAPPGLAERITAGLPRRGRVLSLPALARLAAAVLLAVGTWVAAIGGTPSLAHAETPPLVQEVLAPTRTLLPDAALALPPLAPTEDDVPPSALAAVGLALLAGGLFLARRANTHPNARTSPTPPKENAS